MWRMISANKSARRLRFLANSIVHPVVRPLCYRTDGSVSIGDVSIKLKQSAKPELVPIKYASKDLPQINLKSLRWLMQKDKLGQDVFLIGPPGPMRRALAMQYLELTNSEVEYIALSRDTTESDLKQRREIRSSTAYYMDQCAVRAAIEGRVLVLEGIEKAERNVLPVLNNLLENREMQLEDGRFLMAAARYDTLLKEHTKEELDAWKLVRVSEDFRVIALGLPVPRYHGNPLDPPLRSRFQARDVHLLPYKDQLAILQKACPDISPERVVQIVSFAQTLQSSELSSAGLPDFPIHHLISIAKIMEKDPHHSLEGLVSRLYPYEIMLGEEGQKIVQDTMKTFQLDDKTTRSPSAVIGEIFKTAEDDSESLSTIQINKMPYAVELKVPSGTKSARHDSTKTNTNKKFVMTQYHSNLLSDMMESHAVQDFCLVGPKGCGKSVLVQQLANMLGYRTEPVALYQDMTSRDLLQQRITLANGDTGWRPSPLVMAALGGHIAELDGIHRVNPGTLAVLQRLVHDRELHLYDGSRLLRHDRYTAIKEQQNWNDDDMAARGIQRIHPSFRIIGLAEPPAIGSGSSQSQWLNSEILSMFLFHHIKPLARKEEAQVIYEMVPDTPKVAMEQVLDLADRLRNSKDPTTTSIASSLSTRQLLRIAFRLSRYQNEALEHSINKACLSRFLPKLPLASLNKELTDAGIHVDREAISEKETACEIKEGHIHIGQTSVPVYNPDNKTKVPDVLFYEIPQHLSIMEDMLKDFSLGEHLLLVGNQGVGKNKIVDRFLHLLNRPREYIQLHRDTTVQSLTLQPTVEDGVIIYEDSPLVRAVKFGHVLVVDEADKAPTHVTCILKSLVESGEMILGDGRRIISGNDNTATSANTIQTHPDFRMIVLANRPGFPFLGNDFFGALGDIFSCHAVDNPDFNSEMAMLRQYGPAVNEDVLDKLVNAFGELRSRADQGLISYPYSTREVVSVVKHLQAFPDEGVASVVRNVFDFDSYHPEVKEVVNEVMHKHGIPVGATSGNVNLSKEFPLPPPVFTHYWNLLGEDEEKGGAINCPVEERKLKIKGPTQLLTYKKDIDRAVDRSVVFTERLGHWDLPLHESSFVNGVAVGPGDLRGDWIHTLAVNPVSILSLQLSQHSVLVSDISELFPSSYFNFFPKLQMAALGGELKGQVLLHDQNTSTLLQVDPTNHTITLLTFKSIAQNTKQKLTRHFSVSKDNPQFVMCSDFSHENWVAVYQEDSNKMDVIDIAEGVTQHITFPFVIGRFNPFSRDLWLLEETGTDRKYLLAKPYPEAPIPCVLYPFSEESNTSSEDRWQSISTRGLSTEALGSALGDDKRARSNRLAVGKHDYATIAVAQPDQLMVKSPVSFYTFPRNLSEDMQSQGDKKTSFHSKDIISIDSVPPICLPATGQVIRLVPNSLVPRDRDESEERTSQHNLGSTGHLEVVDVGRRSARYLPFYGSHQLSIYARYSGSPVFLAPTTTDGLVTVDASGRVRLWETGLSSLERSLGEWRSLIGKDTEGPLQVNYSRDSGEDVKNPKHGKVDPDNTPHVGGNTWAGGTGGRDTAGLGGKGGPYRLDAGHDVHQLSDEEKNAVPEEVKQAAREIARRAFKERLREIQMSEYDAEMYEEFSSRVRRQTQSLRVILDSLQAKSLERVWLRHQTSGELDDAKLIDGLVGERAIYKKRGDEEPELGTPQRLPKRLRFVVDASGSMYRFNGLDGRLERMMEAACLVMEAFYQYEDRIKYDIVGHSGESFEIPFVSSDTMPKNNRQRLDVMKQIHAHAQYCMSGDHTLEATEQAVKRVAAEDADEHFVIVLSDANLSRYGISAKQFGKVLTADPKINAFAIFIGSLGNQADRLVKSLPSGHAFQCLDTKLLPQVLQQIFTSSMLNSR